MKLQLRFFRFTLTLCLLFIGAEAHAAQWYHVELIIFEQLHAPTDEQWPHMKAINEGELSSGMTTSMIQPAQNETLVSVAQRLNRSSQYRVHYHNSWLQPIQVKHRAKSINIQSSNDMIAGNVRLYKGTYLHAELDVWLKQNTGLVNSWSDASPNGNDISAPRNPNLNESRRIRSKKIYFFDHPKMGGLLKLTPVETPSAVQSNVEKLETFALPAETKPIVSE